MHAHPATPTLTATDRARLHDLARRRADELRREAIDALWRRIAAALRRPRRALTLLEA